MKIRIEIEEGIAEEEVVIRCRGITKQIKAIQTAVSDVVNIAQKFPLCRGDTEYFVPLDDILFFETEGGEIHAHTRDEIYQAKYKLYELEDMLPGVFMRVSKSTILNINHIYSVNRNLTSSSVVAFWGTHKQVFLSRYYYKPFINKLEEKRVYHERRLR